MNKEKGCTTHFINFFMKLHFLYIQIPEMFISGMSYLLKNVAFWGKPCFYGMHFLCYP